MLVRIETPCEDLLAFEAIGKLSQLDYIRVLEPEINSFVKAGKKFRFLFHFGPLFEGFTAAAAWQDLKVGLRSHSSMERCAVVSDINWLNVLSTFFGGFIPCSVRSYKNAELSDAMAWLDSGEIALDYQLDSIKGILKIEISAPVSSLTFSNLTRLLDSHLEKNGDLKGLVIHTQSFPGWEDFGSVLSHLKFVRNHHRHIKRVALVSGGALPKILKAVSSHFVNAQIEQFPPDQTNEALHWVEAEERCVR